MIPEASLNTGRNSSVVKDSSALADTLTPKSLKSAFDKMVVMYTSGYNNQSKNRNAGATKRAVLSGFKAAKVFGVDSAITNRKKVKMSGESSTPISPNLRPPNSL